jgi:hypothetical protein
MGRSNQIRLKDQRKAYRLIIECCDLGSDPHRWRRHMFEGLCRLVGAHVGIGGEMRDFGRPTQAIVQSIAISELGEIELKHRMRYLTEDGIARHPVFQRFARLRAPLVTRGLEQLIAGCFTSREIRLIHLFAMSWAGCWEAGWPSSPPAPATTFPRASPGARPPDAGGQ